MTPKALLFLGELSISSMRSKTWLIEHRSVIAKLLLFTLAMVVAPLGSYFLTVDTVFSGTSCLACKIPENAVNSYRKHYIRWGYGSGCCERCLDHIRPGSYGRGYQGAGGSEEITIGQKGRWAVYYLILIQPARRKLWEYYQYVEELEDLCRDTEVYFFLCCNFRIILVLPCARHYRRK